MTSLTMKKCIGTCLGILMAIMTAIPTHAQIQDKSLGKVRNQEVDMKEVESFTDSFFKSHMQEEHVPGVAIAFVKGDEVAFMKGYGYADLDNKIEIDPKKTVFGIGSVSKILTSTAALKEYEKGHIDMDADINQYLTDIQIKENFKKPVTMKTLLTHSAGFIQSSIGIGTRNSEDVIPLSNYLKESMPEQVYEPGTYFVYSNQGMALAGHIVEETSGIPFTQYIEKEILNDITMKEMHSQQFCNQEGMPGQAYGFWESYENNRRGLFHTGTTDGYANLLYFMPDEKIGFMLSYNRASEKLRTEFLSSFLDTFFPTTVINKSQDNLNQNLSEYEGLYWNVEKPQKTLDKLEVIMSDGLIKVKINQKGNLFLTNYYGQEIGEYKNVGDGTFQRVNNEELIRIRNEKNICLFVKNNAFRKVRWYENPIVSMILAGIAIVIMLVSCIIAISQKIRVKKQGTVKEKKTRLMRKIEYIKIGTTLLTMAFISLVAIISMRLGKYAFMFGIPMTLRIVLCVPWLLCVIWISLIVINIIVWKKPYGTLYDRIGIMVYALAAFMLLMALKFWNMIIWVK